MVSTDTAKARAPAGISSTAMMATSSPMTVAKARANVWVAPNHAMPGASAPSAVIAQAATSDMARTARRPRRSAPATMIIDSSTPMRTAASSVP